jgi:hypothetical protein
MTEAIKGWDILTDKEADKNEGTKITWKHDKEHISAYKNNHKEGFYHISKRRCFTKEEQFDWISHVCEKVWVNNYKFKEAFIKALKSWDLWKI